MMERSIARTRAEALVSRMTMEERAGQLRYDAPAIDRLGIPAYNWWNEALHGVARAGTATVFPQAIGLAAMFDDTLLEEIADVIATEGRAKYNAQSGLGDRDIYKGLTFWSPNINIFRDPRWGRGHETYGEDPYLTARMGTAFVRGLQGKGKYLKSAACAKHLAVHSGPEDIRHEFDARVSAKDLYETYLPAFEALVKEAGVEAVMGAYNRVNGEPACGSRMLLHDILREKWGFEGHVVSDCWAIADFHEYHRVTDTPTESAALAIQNGCDLNCGVTYLQLLQALQEGLITEEQITRSAVRVMTTRILLGMMDDDNEYDRIPLSENDTDAHHALALVAAEKSMVLLKNDGILPLQMDALRTIAVIGPNADSIRALEGNYNGTASRNVTFLQGIRAACGEHHVRVLYAEGSHLYKDRTTGLAGESDRLAEALACAALADVVILCVGLDASVEGESGDTSNEYSAGDKRDLELPPAQQSLVRAMIGTGKPVVTVVSAGSALRVEEGDAVLLTWYPGQAGGTALANLLFGKVSPSGKLPVTFYRSISDLPDFCDYSMQNRTYRYFTGKPLYPFGFGLTYGRVALGDLRAEWAEDGLRLRVRVQNTGRVDVEETVQIYLRNEDSAFAPPHPVLVGFRRVRLPVGVVRDVALTVAWQAFTVVNDAGERIRDGKRYTVYAGCSQPDAQSEGLAGIPVLEKRVAL